MDSFLEYLVHHKKVLQQKNHSLPIATLQEYIEEFQESQPTPQMRDPFSSEMEKIPENLQTKESSPLPFRDGTSSERYHVLETLGEGGMGVVQLVEDSFLGRKVALKKIKEPHHKKLSSKQQILLWRLKKEASITAKLEHPNIVPLYDLQQGLYGELQFTMRKIEGETLKSILKRHQKEQDSSNPSTISTQNKLLGIFFKVCEAVSYAHSRGVVHRDLKPENIMVGQFGEVYVMDWGISKELFAPDNEAISQQKSQRIAFQDNNIAFENDTTLEEATKKELAKTLIGQIFNDNETLNEELLRTKGSIGTEGYMSPEQYKNASRVTPQADIYALGIILRECFTFHSPYDELQQKLKFYQHRTTFKFSKFKQTNTLDTRYQKIPKDIQAIIKKATASIPSQRYANIGELVQDIEKYQNHDRVSARTYNFKELVQKWFKRNKTKVFFGSTLLLLFLLFFLTRFWEKQKEFLENYRMTLQKAQQFQKKSNEIPALLEDKPQIGTKISYLLSALYSFNQLLRLKNGDIRIEEAALKISQELVHIACKTENYHLANYVSYNLENLPNVALSEKQAIKDTIEIERNRVLNTHKERLQYWLEAMKNAEQGMVDLALLEISKMQEEEIFQQLSQLVQTGTRYFLKEKHERTLNEEKYFIFLAEALGRLEKPAAREILVPALLQISEKMIAIPFEERKGNDFDYLLTLVKALAYSRAKNVSLTLYKIRWQMGQNKLFWQKTDFFYRLFLSIDQFDEENFPSQDASILLLHGTLKEDQGQLQEALDLYQKTTQQNPHFAKAYSFRGKVLYELKRYSEAIEDFNTAISLDPNNAISYFMRGLVQVEQQAYQEALQDYSKALELNPKFTDAYNNIGNVKSHLKDFEGAIQEYTKALQIDPRFIQALENRANMKLMQRNFQGTIQDTTQAIKINPKSINSYLLRGEAKEKLYDWNGAFEDYHQATQMDPQNGTAYAKLGALKLNQALNKLSPSQKASYSIDKKDEWDQELSEEGIRYLDEAIRLLPNESNYYNIRGRLKNVTGKEKEAIEDLKIAIQLDPNNITPLLYLITILQRKRDFDSTIFYCDQILRIDPQNSEAFFYRGNTKNELQNFSEAILDYDQAIRLNPNFVEALNQRALTKSEVNDLQGALEDFEKVIQLSPHFTIAYINRSSIKEQLGDLSGAIDDCNKAIQMDPNDSRFYVNRGTLKAKAKDLLGAINDFQQAIYLDPKDALAYYNLGINYQQLKEIDQALSAYEHGLKLQSHPTILNRFAQLALEQIVQHYRTKEFQKAKEGVLRFQKVVPRTHPLYQKIPQMLQQIEKQLEKKE